MIRRDFFELVDYAVGHGIGVKFSTNGTFIDAAAARRLAAMDYLDVQISLDGTDAATNDAVRGDGSYATARRAMDHLADAGLRAVQDLRRRHPPQRRPARRVQGARRLVRRPAAGHPAAPVGPRRRLVARAAPDERPAAPDLPLAARPRRRRAHRRLVLPPQRARRAAARAQHVRRRAGRVPDRPDRRRLRLPVRDPRRVQGRLGPRRRAGSRTSGSRASCSVELREPQSAGACAICGSYDACQGGCMAAKFFTGLPLDGPDPECVSGHGELALAGVAAGARRDRRWTTPGRHGRTPVTFLRKYADVGGAAPGGVPARHVPERSTRRPRQRRRHHHASAPATRARRTSPARSAGARASWVFVLDALKGALAAGLGLLVDGRPARLLCCGAAAIVGHMFPIIRRFRGGKGVATGAGVMAVLHPLVAVVARRSSGSPSRALTGKALDRVDRRRRRCCPIGLVVDRRAGLGVRRPRSACACSSWPATSATSSGSWPARNRSCRRRPDATARLAVDATARPRSTLGPRTAPNRVMFGPHVTNLGDDDRRFTARHVAYYERRARGGCGTIVVEGASVHESDWPYERAPLAARCRDGLGGDRRRLPAARRARHRLARPRRRAGLVGLQPAPAVGAVAGARGRHPRGAEVDGGRRHRRRRRRVRARPPSWPPTAGCDGVEINAGQHSLVRQFLSG